MSDFQIKIEFIYKHFVPLTMAKKELEKTEPATLINILLWCS